MVKIRLIGRPDDVEAITRDLRQIWTVIEEHDYPARSEPGFIRRYLKLLTVEVHESNH